MTLQEQIKAKQIEIALATKTLNNLRNDLANLNLDLQVERLSAQPQNLK